MRLTLIVAVLCCAALSAANAQAADVDWKMYGTAFNGREVCFYEGNGVIKRPALRVWAKCLLQKDLDIEIDSELAKKIAQKVIRGYIPPIALVEDAHFDDVIIVTQYEETANLGNIQAQARFFYELNCSERMTRELSIYVRDLNGKEGFSKKPNDWQYAAPETNGARLLKILCRTQNLNAGAQ